MRDPEQIRMSDPALETPTIDPVTLIAGLLGPGILRSLVGGVGGAMAGEAAPQMAEQGFSQSDMLLSRLRAAQPKLAQRIENLSVPIGGKFPSQMLDKATAPYPLQMPPLNSPTDWLEHPWYRNEYPLSWGMYSPTQPGNLWPDKVIKILRHRRLN